MIKKILSLLFFLAFVFPLPVLAGNDLTITCTPADVCTKSTDLPLFSETSIFPGYSVQQILTVVSQRTDNCQLSFKIVDKSQPAGILADKINVEVISASQTWYSGSLEDLFSSLSSQDLGILSPGSTQNYVWTAAFDSSAGNEYQSLISVFDLNLNLSCEAIAITPTLTPIPGGGQDAAAPVCTDPAPAAPTNFYTQRHPNGSVTLYWTHTSSPHTGYLIAYGTTPGIYLYGHPDVGNVSRYTVGSLTYGAQYCFYVRSLNGCMPGLATEERCVNPGSAIIATTTPPVGFQPGVLGTEVTTPSEVSGLIGGVTAQVYPHSWLPILYLPALIVFFIRRHRLSFFYLLLPIVAYLIDNYLLHSRDCLIYPLYCRYFSWLNLTVFILGLFYLSRRP
jgi:hypothetical protein